MNKIAAIVLMTVTLVSCGRVGGDRLNNQTPGNALSANANAPKNLSVLGPSQNVAQHACSEKVVLKLKNNQDVGVEADEKLTFNLSHPKLQFFSDKNCSNAINKVVFNVGDTKKGFYYKGATLGAHEIVLQSQETTLADGKKLSGTHDATIFQDPKDLPASLRITAAALTGTLNGHEVLPNIKVEILNGRGEIVDPLFLSETDISIGFSDNGINTSWLEGTKTQPMVAGEVTFTDLKVLKPGSNYRLVAESNNLYQLTGIFNIAGGNFINFDEVSQNVDAGVCSDAITVSLQDVEGVDTVAPADISYTPELNLTGVTFYSDNTCSTDITNSLAIPTGFASQTIYMVSEEAGTLTYTEGSELSLKSPLEMTVGAAAPDQFGFKLADGQENLAQSLTAGTCSAVTKFELQDEFGNTAIDIGSDQTANLSSDEGTLTFYDDAGCTNPITQVTIPAGNDEGEFYFSVSEAPSTPTITLTDNAATLNSAQQIHTVNPGNAQGIAANPAISDKPVGECSDVSVELVDVEGNASGTKDDAAYSSTFDVALASGTVYAGAGCSGAPITEFTSNPGDDTLELSFIPDVTGANSLTVTDQDPAGMGTMTDNFNVTASTPSKLALVGTMQDRTAGLIMETDLETNQFLIETQDNFGNRVAQVRPLEIEIVSAPADALAVQGDIDINSDANGRAYFSDIVFRAAGTYTIRVNDTSGVAPLASTDNITFTITAAAPDQIGFDSDAQTLMAGDCSSTVTLEVQDEFGNATALTQNETINLGGSAGISYYPASGCVDGLGDPVANITTVDMLLGDTTAEVLFIATTTSTSQVNDLTLTNGTLNPNSQTQTITAAAATKLAFVGMPTEEAVGDCLAIEVEARDPFDNPTRVASSTLLDIQANDPGSATASFYSNSGCTDAPVPVSLSELVDSTTIYLSTLSMGNLLLSADVEVGETNPAPADIDPIQANVTITPAPPIKFGYYDQTDTKITDGFLVTAGDCSPPLTIKLLDQYNNASESDEDVSINLATDNTDLDFFEGGDCDGGSFTTTITSLTFTAGETEKTITFQARGAMGGSAGTPGEFETSLASISTDGNLHAQTETIDHTVVPTDPSIIRFAKSDLSLQTDLSLQADECSEAIRITARDAFSNPVEIAASITVDLTSNNGTLAFYTNNDCTGPITDITWNTTSESAEFYFKATDTQNGTFASPHQYNLTATINTSQPSLVGQSHDLVQTLQPGDATNLAIGTQPTDINAGSFINPAVTVELHDDFGNVAYNSSATIDLELVTNPTSTNFSAGSTLSVATAANTGIATFSAVSVETTELVGATYTSDYSLKAVDNAATLTESAESNSFTVTPLAASKLAFITTTHTLQAGACSDVVTVQSQDTYNNPSQVSSDTVLDIALASSTIELFAEGDTTCTGVALAGNQVTLLTGESNYNFRYKVSAIGQSEPAVASSTLALSATRNSGDTLTLASQDNDYTPGSPVDFKYEIVGGDSTVAGVCSAALKVSTVDEFDNYSPVATSTQVNLSLTDTANAAANIHSACNNNAGDAATIITDITYGANEYTKNLFLKGTLIGDLDLNLVVNGGEVDPSPAELVQSAAYEHEITFAPANKLVIDSAFTPQTLTAGDCSTEVQVHVEDEFDNDSEVSGVTTLTLAGTGMYFYTSGAACAADTAHDGTGGVTTLTLSPGVNPTTASIYFKPTTSGSIDLTIDDQAGSLTEVTQTQTVNPNNAAQIAFVEYAGDPMVRTLATPQTLVAGACSTQLTVQVRDEFGNPTTTAADATIDLVDSEGSGFFTSNSSCAHPDNTGALTQVVITNGNTVAHFYARDTVSNEVSAIDVGKFTIDATASSTEGDLDTATTSLTHDIVPDTPTELEFNVQPSETVAGVDISPAIEVFIKDQFGNRAYNGSATIDLAIDTNPGSTTLQGTTSVATTASTGGATFNAVNIEKIGVGYTLEASSGALGTDTSSAFDITPATAVKLAFNSTTQTSVAGECASSDVVIESRDEFDNPSPVVGDLTITPTATNFTFFAAGDCANHPSTVNEIITIDLLDGTSQIAFEYYGTEADDIDLNISSSLTDPSAQAQTIEPADATQIILTNSEYARDAGECGDSLASETDFLTIETRDQFNNPTPKGDYMIDLNSSAAGGTFTFYESYADCSGVANAVTQTQLAEGVSERDIFFRGTSTGTITYTVDHGSLTADSQDVEIAPAPPSGLVFLDGYNATDVVAGANMDPPIRIEFRDVFDNPVPTAGTPVKVYLISEPTDGVMSGTTQVTPSTGVSEFSTLNFNKEGTYQIEADLIVDGIFTPIQSATFEVTPAPATIIKYVAGKEPDTRLNADECSSEVEFTIEDQFDNTSPVDSITTYTLGPDPDVTFYATAGDCATDSNPITTIDLGIGESNATFYFKSTVATFTTTDGALTTTDDTPHVITVDNAGVTEATSNTTIAPLAPSQFVFHEASDFQLDAGECANTGSTNLTVKLLDSFGNRAPVQAGTENIILAAIPAGGGTMSFYSESTCTTGQVSPASFATGVSLINLFADSTNPDTYTVTFNALASDISKTVTVVPAAPRHIVYTTPEIALLEVGQCADSALNFNLTDEFGNITQARSDITVTFTGDQMTAFNETDLANCQSFGVTGSTTLTIPTGDSSLTYRVKGTKAGTINLVASAPGITENPTGGQDHVLAVAEPYQLVMSSAVQNDIVAGNCSAAVVFQVQDQFGNPSGILAGDAPYTINLGGTDADTNALRYYSTDATGCTGGANQITSLDFAQDQYDSPNIFVATTKAGAIDMIFSDPLYVPAPRAGLSQINQAGTVVPNTPASLAITREPVDIVAGSNITPGVQVTLYDAHGNIADNADGVDVTVALNNNPTADGALELQGTLTQTINDANNGVTSFDAVTLLKTGSGFTIDVSSSGLTTVESAGFNVTPSTPELTSLELTEATLKAGQCIPVQSVDLLDQYSNPTTTNTNLTIDLDGDGDIIFYDDVGCTNPITSIVIGNPNGSGDFYFKNSLIGDNQEVRTEINSIGASSQAVDTINVTPDDPAQLAINMDNYVAPRASECSGEIALEVQDQWGNQSAIPTQTVTLSSTGTPVTFHRSNDCSDPGTTTVDFTASSSELIYVTGTDKGTFNLTIDSPDLTLATENSIEIRAALPTKLLITSTAQTLQAGECSGDFILEAHDQFDNQAEVDTGKTVQIDLSAPNTTFYSDDACTGGNEITSVDIIEDTYTSTVYFATTKTGTETITVAHGNDGAYGSLLPFVANTQDQTITHGDPDHVAIIQQPGNIQAGNAFTPAIVIELQDEFNNVVDTATDDVTLSIAINPSSGSLLNTNVVAMIDGEATFDNLSIDKVGNGYTLQVNTVGVPSISTNSFDVTANEAFRFAFQSLTQEVQVGNCSSLVTIITQDEHFNTTTPTRDITVDLGYDEQSTFFSTASCEVGTEITDVTILGSSAQNTATFYFRPESPPSEVINLTDGTDPGSLGPDDILMADASQAYTIRSAAATKLVFEALGTGDDAHDWDELTAGACSGVITVTATDEFGNPSFVPADLVVSLSGGSAQFFSESTCSNPLVGQQQTIVENQTSAEFYFNNELAETFTLRGTATGLGDAIQEQIIVPAEPAKLVYNTAAQNDVVVGNCSGAVTVELQDEFDNVSTAEADFDLEIRGNFTPLFFSDDTCDTGLTFVDTDVGDGDYFAGQIPTGSSEYTFYYTREKSGALTITTNSGALTPATDSHALLPDSITQMAFTTLPQSVSAGFCSAAVRIQTRDQYNNPSEVLAGAQVNLSNDDLDFYPEEGCGNGSEQGFVTILEGESSADIYVKGIVTGTHAIAAQLPSLSLVPVQVNHNVTAGQAVQIGFVEESKTIKTADAPSSYYCNESINIIELQLQDQYGNPADRGDPDPAIDIIKANLSSDVGVGMNSPSFHTFDDYCLNQGIVQTSTPIIPNDGTTSTVQLYVRQQSAGDMTVYASHNNSFNPFYFNSLNSIDITVEPNKAEHAEITNGGGFSLTVGDCNETPINIQMQDLWNNPTTVRQNLDIGFTHDGEDIFFYSDENCTAAITDTRTMLNGEGEVDIYVQTNKAQTIEFTFTIDHTLDADLTDDQEETRTIAINPEAPTRLVFNTTNDSVAAGSCSDEVIVEMQDDLGNSAPIEESARVTIELSDPLDETMTFYSDENCQFEITERMIFAGNTEASFYFKGEEVRDYTIVINNDLPVGLTLAEGDQTYTLTTPVATELVWVDPDEDTEDEFWVKRLPKDVCSNQVQLQTQNFLGNATAVVDPITVDLIGSNTGGYGPERRAYFYSDSDCTTQITTLDFDNITTTHSLYYRVEGADISHPPLYPTKKTQYLYAQHEDMNEGEKEITALDAAKPALTNDPFTTVFDVCSEENIVSFADFNDEVGNMDRDVEVTVSVNGTWDPFVTFYSDDTCATELVDNKVTVSQGSTASFYYSRPFTSDPIGPSGTMTIYLDADADLIQGSQDHNVIDTKLVFTTPGRTTTAGECSDIVTVQARDSQNNAYTDGTNRNIQLLDLIPGIGNAQDKIEIYTDENCTTRATYSSPYHYINLPPGESTIEFYYKYYEVGISDDPETQDIYIDARHSDFKDTRQMHYATAAAPVTFVFYDDADANDQLVANDCSFTWTEIQLRDQYNNTTNALTGGHVIDLDSLGSDISYFSDSGCTNPITDITVTAGSSRRAFYFKADSATESRTRTLSLTGTFPDPDLGPDLTPNRTKNIDVLTRTIAFTDVGAYQFDVNECDEINVQIQDMAGNPQTLLASRNLSLSGTNMIFYSDDSCSTPITTIPTGTAGNTLQFWVKTKQLGNMPIEVDHADFVLASRNVEGTYGQNLKFKLEPTETELTAGANGRTLQYFTINVTDQDDESVALASNTNVTLTSTSDITYKRGTRSCGSNGAPNEDLDYPTTDSIFLRAQSLNASRLYSGNVDCLTSDHQQGEVYFTITEAGSHTIDIAATGFDANSVTFDVLPAGPHQWGFGGDAPLALFAGQCSGELPGDSGKIRLQVQDTYGNETLNNKGANLPVDLRAESGAYFTDSACTNQITMYEVPDGESGLDLYFKAYTAPVTTLILNNDDYYDFPCGGYEQPSCGRKINNNQVDHNVTELPLSDVGFAGIAESNLVVGECSGLQIVQMQDLYGNTKTADANYTVTLSGPSVGANETKFFSAADCNPGSEIANGEIQFLTGESQKNFYFTSPVAGDIDLTASTVGLNDNTQTHTLILGELASLVFPNDPITFAAGSCSEAISAGLADEFGNLQQHDEDVTISIATNNGALAYRDELCINPVTSLTITAGNETRNIYLKSTTAGTTTIDIDEATLTAASQDNTVVSGPPVKLDYGTPAQTVVAGDCSASATRVIVADTNDNTAIAISDVTVNLSGTSFTFYSADGCDPGDVVTSLTIPTGANGVDLWYTATQSGSRSIIAASPTLPSSTQVQTISVAPASKFVVTSGAQTLQAGDCSQEFALKVQDRFNNDANVAADTEVTLSGDGMYFYPDLATCLNAKTADETSAPEVVGINSVTISAGSANQTLYFRGKEAGATQAINLSATGFDPQTQNQTIIGGDPARLGFTNDPISTTAGNCSTALAVVTQDLYGNNATVPSDVAVSFSGDGTTEFFTSPTCSGSSTSLSTIAGGSASTSIYFKTNTAGDFTVTASAGGMISGEQTNTVTPGVASRLRFPLAELNQDVGDCGLVTVQSQDIFTNPSAVDSDTAVTLGLTGVDVQLYLNDDCLTNPVIGNEITLTNASSDLDVYVYSEEAGDITITAAATDFNGSGKTHTINPLQATHLGFQNLPLTTPAGECSDAVVLTRHDLYGNQTTLGARDVIVDLSATDADLAFYSDDNCSTNIPTKQVTLLQAQTEMNLYVQTNDANVKTIQADDISSVPAPDLLITGTVLHTVSALEATRLAYISSAHSMTADDCVALEIELRDEFDNRTSHSADQTVDLTLSGITNGEFFDSTDCSGGAVTDFTVTAGSENHIFSFHTQESGNADTDATITGFSPDTASQTQTIAPKAATHLGFAAIAPGAETTAGTCSYLVTVETQDEYGNPSYPVATTVAGLSSINDELSFFTSNTCNPGDIIASNEVTFNGAHSVEIYFKGDVSGTQTISATRISGDALTVGDQDHTIVPDTPDKLGINRDHTNILANHLGCYEFGIQSQDHLGNASIMGSDVNFDLTVNGSNINIYSDDGCTSTTTSGTILAGTSQLTLYARSSEAQDATVDLADDPGPVDTGLENTNTPISVVANTPVALRFKTDPRSTRSGDCSGQTVDNAVIVELIDAYTNVATTVGNRTIDLSNSHAEFDFHQNDDCSDGAVTSVTITGGNSETDPIYFTGIDMGTYQLRAESAGLTLANQDNDIEANRPIKLAYTTNTHTQLAGECSDAITIQTQDLNGNASLPEGNVLVNLGGNAAEFYTASNCLSGQITDFTMTTASHDQTIYLRSELAQDLEMTAQTNDLLAPSSINQTHTINPAAPVQLAFNIPFTGTIAAGSCSNTSYLESQDEFGNTSNVTGDVLASFINTGDVTVFSDYGCQNAITDITISNGTNTTELYFRNDTVEAYDLEADNGGLTNATRSIASVANGANVKIVDGTGSSTEINSDSLVMSTDHTESLYVRNLGDEESGTITTQLSSVDLTQWTIFSDTCNGQTLAPGAECVVQLRFQGLSMGAPQGQSYSSDIKISTDNNENDDGGGSHIFSLDIFFL